jgi:hypothetical protein
MIGRKDFLIRRDRFAGIFGAQLYLFYDKRCWQNGASRFQLHLLN